MELKQQIIELAQDLGFQHTVIADLQPLSVDRKRYQDWLDNGFAADMEYLKRNPEFRTTPSLLYPQSLSAIVVSASYYSEPPLSPGDHFGKVANYAVGLDYHPVLRAKLRELRDKIEALVGRKLLSKPYTDDVALYEQGLALRHGLGFRGKNTLIIGPKLSGSYNFIAELLTDLPLPADESYIGTCGQCFRCGDACPTGAIVNERTVDARLCISYLTIENKGGIAPELRPKLGDWVFGCDVCQDVCPYNQRPAKTPWKEFRPESGVGHYINLFDLLKISSEEDFRLRFAPTPLRRPKRRGLLRNALVVLGNRRPTGGIERMLDFALSENEPMLREHAAWAISCYQDTECKKALERLHHAENDESVRAQMACLL
jgi:epoxyqueuosine reductase